MFDFDKVIDRQGTDSIKYDFARERGKPEGLLPLWVADMDFSAPPCVIEALEQRSRHGIFGYSEAGDDYFEPLYRWLDQRLGWQVQEDWLIKTPGIVFAISAAIRALTAKGDSVLIQQPVYYPFYDCVNSSGRRPVVNQLVYEQGTYRIDFEDFEQKIQENNVKLFILCSPHNPVGRVWKREELCMMGDICLRHGVRVVADEIHADFVYPGHKHHVFAGLKPEYGDMTLTCTAPSKTFNLAGLQISNVFAANSEIRKALNKEIRNVGYSQVGSMGLAACRAAYAGGGPWLEQLLVYLSDNFAFLRTFLTRNIPELSLVETEGTYLGWIDCGALSLDDRELDRFMLEEAGLWLDDGPMFGAGGSGFQRINVACPRSVLAKAVGQLEQAVAKRRGQ
ncbi:MAG: MalY/PatB family protein [Christensenellales bacterium]|jgi:cystathionine beta-lyase